MSRLPLLDTFRVPRCSVSSVQTQEWIITHIDLIFYSIALIA